MRGCSFSTKTTRQTNPTHWILNPIALLYKTYMPRDGSDVHRYFSGRITSATETGAFLLYYGIQPSLVMAKYQLNKQLWKNDSLAYTDIQTRLGSLASLRRRKWILRRAVVISHLCSKQKRIARKASNLFDAFLEKAMPTWPAHMCNICKDNDSKPTTNETGSKKSWNINGI